MAPHFLECSATQHAVPAARYSFNTKSTTNLTLWQVDSPTVKGDGYAQLIQLTKQFSQKYHIDITVDYVQFTSNSATASGGFAEKVSAAAASNNPPDLVQLSGASNYAFVDAARPLDSYFSSSSIKQSAFIPGQLTRDKWDGHIYGVPIGADANALFFWNHDLFKKYGLNPDAPPTTWDELLTMSEQISKAPSNKPKVKTLGFIPSWGQFYLIVLYYQLGPEYVFSEAGATAWRQGMSSPKVLLNDQYGIEALNYYLQLSDANGGAQVLASFSEGFGSGLQDPFISGKVAMQCNGNWNQPVYAVYAPHLNYGVSELPIPPNGVKCTTSGGFSWSIPTKATAADEAWQWIEFASEPENQLYYVKGLGTNPTLIELLGDSYFQSNPVRKVAVEAIRNARGWGESPWSSIFWDQFVVDAVQEVTYHKAAVKDALDQAAAVTQQAINSYT